MPGRRIHLADGPALRRAFSALRAELDVPATYPAAAVAEAERAARVLAERMAAGVERGAAPRVDRTDIPLVTIDPPGSMDLDQALWLGRTSAGYRVEYAIADVAAFVVPAGAVDGEARRRGETLYSPDSRAPLHPDVLGEGAASLLPDQVRPALLWSIDLDAQGEPVSTDLRRALVRSRARLDYAQVQADLDSGRAEEWLLLLRDVGRLRQERERARGAVSLRIPEQEVVPTAQGFALRYRAPLPAEDWNAQISLLTGICAARIMLEGGVGLLRTLPEPDPATVASLRRSARVLQVSWPAEARYADVVRGLDPGVPAQAALLELATRLLRGAGYVAFDGTPPQDAQHSAVAAPYAHVTAPLRRLADRFAAEACLAVVAGAGVPDWVREALPALPELMAAAGRRSGALDHAVVALVEATLLAPHLGEEFDAVVVEVNKDHGEVQLAEPAVRGRCDGAGLPLGEPLRVRLVEANPARREVRFVPA